MRSNRANRWFGLALLGFLVITCLAGAGIRPRSYYPTVSVPRWYTPAFRGYALFECQNALMIAAIKKHHLMTGKMPASYDDLVKSGALLFQPLNSVTGLPVQDGQSPGDIHLSSAGETVYLQIWYVRPDDKRFTKKEPPGPKQITEEINAQKYVPNHFYVANPALTPDPHDPSSTYDKIPISDKPGWIATLNAEMLANGIHVLHLMDGGGANSKWEWTLSPDSVFKRLKKIDSGWTNPFTGQALALNAQNRTEPGALNLFYDAVSQQVVVNTYVQANGDLWEYVGYPHFTDSGSAIITILGGFTDYYRGDVQK